MVEHLSGGVGFEVQGVWGVGFGLFLVLHLFDGVVEQLAIRIV
jgi:hypothetical protein